MKAHLSYNFVDNIKTELLRLLPDVKSAHRVEAMARGFGWNSNAALRAELAMGPQERTVDNGAFSGYLTSHGFTGTPPDVFREAVARCAIEAVMERTPLLTHFGFGIFDERDKSPQQREAEFRHNRERMRGSLAIAEFIRAYEFLEQVPRRTTINRNRSSYGLKHEAERFHRERGVDNPYVANGMFIAAAIYLDFKIQQNGPNAHLNVGTRRPRLLRNGRMSRRKNPSHALVQHTL